MSISPPIQGSDLSTLPDDTAFVEDLAAKDHVDAVLPKFVGDGDTGRFVTAFFVLHDDTLTLYARRREGDSVDFEKITAAPVGKPVARAGALWNQTLSFDDDDVDAVVDLRERAAYETYWLFAGNDLTESFESYRLDPTTAPAPGFADCDHVPADEPEPVPNLGIQISSCAECDAPLFLTGDGAGTRTMAVLNAVHIDEAFGDSQIRGFRTVPDGEVSGREEALHVLSRLANNENPSLDRYARAGREALIFLVGDQICAYATWEHVDDRVLLRAIYVLPEYRGEGGLAETVVNAFYDEIDTDDYLVETPNEPGRRALARAGHLDTGVATPVATLATRDTTDAGDPGAIYSDPRPREFHPVR